MKKSIFINILLAFMTVSAFAQPSSLTVFSEEGDKFWVILNGAKQNATAMAKVVVPGQNDQFQKLRIIFEDEKIPTLDQSIQFTDMDNKWNDITYAIKKNNKGKYVLR